MIQPPKDTGTCELTKSIQICAEDDLNISDTTGKVCCNSKSKPDKEGYCGRCTTEGTAVSDNGGRSCCPGLTPDGLQICRQIGITQCAEDGHSINSTSLRKCCVAESIPDISGICGHCTGPDSAKSLNNGIACCPGLQEYVGVCRNPLNNPGCTQDGESTDSKGNLPCCNKDSAPNPNYGNRCRPIVAYLPVNNRCENDKACQTGFCDPFNKRCADRIVGQVNAGPNLGLPAPQPDPFINNPPENTTNPIVGGLNPARTCITEGDSGPAVLKCCIADNFENVDNSGQIRKCTKPVPGVCTSEGNSAIQQTNLLGTNHVPCCKNKPLIEVNGICRLDPSQVVYGKDVPGRNCIADNTDGDASLACCSPNALYKFKNDKKSCILNQALANAGSLCALPNESTKKNVKMFDLGETYVPCCQNLTIGSAVWNLVAVNGICVPSTNSNYTCTNEGASRNVTGKECCSGLAFDSSSQLICGKCTAAGQKPADNGDRGCCTDSRAVNGVCTKWISDANPAPAYLPLNAVCSVGFQCASQYCNPTTKKCAAAPNTTPTATPFVPGGSKGFGADCTNSAQCTSRYCDPSTRTCAYSPNTTPTATPFVPSGSRAFGADCTNSTQCLTQYCHPLARVCAYSPYTTPTPTPFVPRGNKDNGEDCTNGAQCKSGFCSTAKVCADRPTPAPAPICNNRNCQAGFSCQGGVCRQDANLGQMCADGIRCGKDEYCTSKTNGTCVSKTAVPTEVAPITGQAPAPACTVCTSNAQCSGNTTCQNGCCQAYAGGIRVSSCQRQCGPKCPGQYGSCDGSSWYFDAYSDDGRGKGSNCGAGPTVDAREACIRDSENACCYGEVGDQSHCITVNKFTQKNAVNTKNNGKLAVGYDVTADFTKDFVRWQWPGQQGNIIAFIKGEFGQVDGGAKFALTRTTSTGLKDSQDDAKYFSGVIKNLTPGKHVIQMGWNPDSATGQPHTVMCKPSTVEMVHPANCSISFTAGGKRQEANPFLTYNVALGQPIKFEAGMIAPLTPDQAEQVDIFISKTTTVNGWLPAPNRATSKSASTQLSWTPTEKGTYYVVCNGRTKDGFACTGNPWCEGNKCSPFMDCSKTSDKITIKVQ